MCSCMSSCSVCCMCEHLDLILLNQNRKSLSSWLPVRVAAALLHLVSDINFNVFAPTFSILSTFLRISPEIRQRISLFVQTALNQPMPLAGLLFFFIDFKFEQCSDIELCTYSYSQLDWRRPGSSRSHCNCDSDLPWKSTVQAEAPPTPHRSNTCWTLKGFPGSTSWWYHLGKRSGAKWQLQRLKIYKMCPSL